MVKNDRIEELFVHFKNAVKAGRLGHAYLLVGDPRCGAMSLVEKIVCLLLCRSTGDRPCLSCRECGLVMDRRHTDCFWCEPQKKSRTIQVAQIRQMQEHVYQTSYEGGWKTAVVSCADRMNAEAANALLKTLEEPPSRTIFFLLSDTPAAMLPTIVSRCQRILVNDPVRLPERFTGMVAEMMSAGLGKNLVDRLDNARTLGAFLTTLRKEVEDRVGADDQEEDSGEVLDREVIGARVEAEFREMRAQVLEALVLWFRDLLLLVSGADEGDCFYAGNLDFLRATAAGLTFRQAVNNINIVEDMRRQLERHLSEALVLERGFSMFHAG